MYENTMPVQIDRIIDTPQYQIARCAFFRIESLEQPLALADSPSLPSGLPLTVWGDWAVLAGPLSPEGAIEAFGTVEALEEALDRIEETGNLLTDLGYLWMPLSLLREGGANEPSKGDVYRISLPLFSYGYSRTLSAKNIDACADWRAPEGSMVRYSEGESETFRQWRSLQIDRSRKLARARKERAGDGEDMS